MTRTQLPQPMHAAIILALLALGVSPDALARSGSFSFVTGLVEVQSGSLKRAARAGMEVNEGDIITTGTNGMAQLEMVDQAKLSLRSNSRLIVQRYPESPMDASRTVQLTRGTLRAFTALLSETNKKQYTMRTRVATVGIRGSGNILNTSDDETVTLNYTIEGKHFVSANEGNFSPIETFPNQTVQVVLGQAPKIIPTPPSLLDAGKTMVGSGSGTTGQGQSGGDGGGNPPQNPGGPGTGNVVGGNGLGYTLIDATANLTSDPVNLQNIVIATNGTAFSDQAVPGQISLDAGALRGYTAYAGGTALNISGGTAADLQTITIGGATTVVLGRFASPSAVTFTGTAFAPNGSTHFGYGGAGFPAYLSDVLTGSVSYQRVGATTPTNQFGTLGQLTSAVLDVNFTARTLNAALGISMPTSGNQAGGTWNLQASNVPFSFNSFVAFTGGGRLTVSNGNGQNSNSIAGLSGWIEGSFIGAALNGALLGYGVLDQSGASSGSFQSINGVVAFAGPSQNAGASYREGLVSDPRGALSVASFQRSFATTNRPDEVTVGANGAVSAFAAPYVSGNQFVGHQAYSQGSASVTDNGTDPATGLVWGRWTGGTATIGGQSTNLAGSSLHYIFSGAQSGPVSLPLTGTGTYDVVGSTRPTDGNGNVGTFGSATLNANFSARTVDTSVTVGINNQTWNGSASGVPIYRDQYFFAAAGNRVAGIPGPAQFNISCTPNCTPQFQRGSIDGFFTGRTGQGAGVMYNMNGIAGAIAFARRGG